MFRNLRQLIERQIQKAHLTGQLSGLQGEGQPLPARTADALGGPADAAGFRIMAEAGVLPEEIEVKKEMARHKERMQGLTGEARKDAMAELARLEMRYNIARDARKKFLRA